MELGYLTTLQCLKREQGFLHREDWLCQAAASSGRLEELKKLRANGTIWNQWTCEGAAQNRQFGVLNWARENGYQWGKETCAAAAKGGQLKMLQWARANGWLPVDQEGLKVCGERRVPRGAAVVVRE